MFRVYGGSGVKESRIHSSVVACDHINFLCLLVFGCESKESPRVRRGFIHVYVIDRFVATTWRRVNCECDVWDRIRWAGMNVACSID